jgi:hypothetical protein
MSVEDKKLARELQRELYRRRHLDLTETKYSVTRCVAYIGGIIRPSMGEYIDPKVEEKALIDGAKRVPGLRDVVFEAKFVIDAKR